MGYFLYTRRELAAGDEYEQLRECPLGGGTNGIICRHLRTLIGPTTTQP